MISCAVDQDSGGGAGIQSLLKAVGIYILPQKKFLILDSVGDLYLLSLRTTVLAPEITSRSSTISFTGQMNRVDATMRVQLFAVHPDPSASMALVFLCPENVSIPGLALNAYI